MAKYRKKPIIVEAEQWFRGKMGNHDSKPFVSYDWGQEAPATILTLQGRVDVFQGDYIITAPNGETYPCNEKVFEETYEKVEPQRIIDPAEKEEFTFKVTGCLSAESFQEVIGFARKFGLNRIRNIKEGFEFFYEKKYEEN